MQQLARLAVPQRERGAERLTQCSRTASEVRRGIGTPRLRCCDERFDSSRGQHYVLMQALVLTTGERHHRRSVNKESLVRHCPPVRERIMACDKPHDILCHQCPVNRQKLRRSSPQHIYLSATLMVGGA